MSATINGQSWTAKCISMTYDPASTSAPYVFRGSDFVGSNTTINISLGATGLGSYGAGAAFSTGVVMIGSDATTAGGIWMWVWTPLTPSMNKGTGVMNATALAPTGGAGTFQFTAPDPNGSGTVKTVTNGRFDIGTR